MQKWLMLMMGIITPCFGSTLKGVVTNSDSMAMYKAKVIVFHDLAMLMSQRKSTDFNGNYHFNLDPGPYRILILKKGFAPLLERILIVSEQEDVHLSHALETREEVLSRHDENRTNRIKEALRGSNLHLRAEDAPTWITASAAQPEQRGGGGLLRTGTHRALNGEVARRHQLELSTRLGERLTLTSALVAESRESGSEVLQLNAALGLKHEHLSLDFEGESIRGQSAADGYSHMARILSSYGAEVKYNTHLQMVGTRLQSANQRQYSLDQEVNYRLGRHHIGHGLTLADWRGETHSFARRTTLTTSWRHEGAKWLSLAAETDQLALDTSRLEAARLWVRGNKMYGRRFGVESSLGYYADKQLDDFIHRTHLNGFAGPWTYNASYAEDRGYQPISGGDILGRFQPLTTRNAESFTAIRNQIISLNLGLNLGTQWFGELAWRKQSNWSRLLYARSFNVFLPEAARRQQRFDYTLSSKRYKASLALSYQENEGTVQSFSQREVALRQTVNPWRNRDLGLLLELRVQDNPDIPAWWLLRQLPWEGNESWYEGHVALQF